MPESKSTVGRIVHYVSYGTPGGEYQSECRAAIVTSPGHKVPGSAQVEVCLCVVNPTGLFFHEAVQQDQGHYADRPGVDGAPTTPSYRGGTWHWPEIV